MTVMSSTTTSTVSVSSIVDGAPRTFPVVSGPPCLVQVAARDEDAGASSYGDYLRAVLDAAEADRAGD